MYNIIICKWECVCVRVSGRRYNMALRCEYTRYMYNNMCLCDTARDVCAYMIYVLHTYILINTCGRCAYYYIYYNRVTPVLHVFNVFVSVCVCLCIRRCIRLPRTVCIYRMFAHRFPDFKYLRLYPTNYCAIAIFFGISINIYLDIMCVIGTYRTWNYRIQKCIFGNFLILLYIILYGMLLFLMFSIYYDHKGILTIFLVSKYRLIKTYIYNIIWSVLWIMYVR